MMRRMIFGIAFALAGMPAVAVEGIQSYMGSGNDVLLLCTSAQGTAGCVAYLAGIADSMAGGNPVAGKQACVPKGVVTGQLVDITVNYLRNHPGARHLM